MSMFTHTIVSVLAGALLAAPCMGQNLFETPAPAPAQTAPVPNAPSQPPAGSTPDAAPAQSMPQPPSSGGPVVGPGAPSPAAQALAGYSMFVVSPPPPRTYAKHDLVEVIVNESSVQRIAQKYDTKKDYDFAAELAQFPSMQALFTQWTLENGIGTPAPSVGIGNKNKYKGDGKMDRSDQVTARLSAIVIDVKPNGTLVLEAKECIQSDREVTTMVLSGICRSEDVTRNNTIQSSQLANLDIRIEHEGDVKDTAEKGLIPRIFETLFNF
jgi:flagellar L-ring protein precursor FlgH